ncbi:MAG TPA: hypothetical protein VMH32_11750 [Burkholderiales bacterium]|nr:hypothetical protein [Burkholderiales bacterium]
MKRLLASVSLLALMSLSGIGGAAAAEDSEIRAARFLDAIDTALAELAPRLPQLRYWGRPRDGYGAPGKIRGGWNIDYTTGVDPTGAGRYKERLRGSDACQISIRVYTVEEFDRSPDSGNDNAIYGAQIGSEKVVVTVITANPESESAESAITSVILAQIAAFNR